MKVYVRKESHSFKWVLAAILFVAVMAFTLAEVNGYPTGSKPTDPGKNNGNAPSTQSMDNGGSNGSSNGDRPSAVPEPGTMLLMAVGIGTAVIIRKSRKIAK